MSHALGWIPDVADDRDRLVGEPETTKFPAVFSIRSQMPPVLDQGQLGSCTAHGTVTAVRYDLIAQGFPDPDLSRLFVYYNTRLMEGDVAEDAGGQVRDAIKSVNRYGVPVETDWPYIEAKFAKKPPKKAYTDGLLRTSLVYAKVSHTEAGIKAALFTDKRPVVFGFTCYEGLESDQTAQTGILPMPSGQSIGGHCVAIIGWSNNVKGAKPGDEYYEIRNSWGSSWGDAGNFWMPAKYLLSSEASDFWRIQTVK